MTLSNLFGYNTLGRLIRFAPADVLAWLFPGGSSTTSDLNVRDLTSNRDFHVGNIFSVLSGTGVTHAQQLSVFGSANGGRAQVEVQTVDGFQATALQNWRDHDGDVIAAVLPTGFAGPAPGITAVPAASLTGTVPDDVAKGVGDTIFEHVLSTFPMSRVAGAVADYDPATGLGTDNTAALAAALNGGNKTLVVNGNYGFAGRVPLYSNTRVVGLPGTTLGKLGRPNLGQPIFVNAHLTPGTAEPVDHDITLIGVNLDGDRRHGGAGNSGSLTAFDNDAGIGVPTVMFAGVRRLKLIDCHVFDNPWFAFMLSNLRDSDVTRCGADEEVHDTAAFKAILALSAGSGGVRVTGLYGTCSDDAVQIDSIGNLSAAALNGGQNVIPAGFYADADTPTRDLTLRDWRVSRCQHAIRFLSLSRGAGDITGVTAANVSAAVLEFGVIFDDFNGGAAPEYGWYDGIVLKNLRFTGGALAGDGDNGGAVYLRRGSYGVVTIKDLYSEHPGSAVRVWPDAQGQVGSLLTIDGVTAGGATPALPVVDLDGTIPVVLVRRPVVDRRPAGAAPAVRVRQQVATLTKAATLTRLAVEGADVRGASALVGVTGFALPDLLVTGGAFDGPGAAVQSDTALPRVVTGGGLDAEYLTDVPAGSVARHDGAGWLAAAIPANVKADLAALLDSWDQQGRGLQGIADGGPVAVEYGRWRGNRLHGGDYGDPVPAYAASVGGRRAIYFNGSSSLGADGLALPVGRAPRTLACWVRLAAVGTQMGILGYGAPLGHQNVVLGILTDGSPFVSEDFDGAFGTALSAGVWYHVAGVFDGTNFQLYVNGAPDGAPVAAPSLDTQIGNGRLYVGRDSITVYKANGHVGGVRVYAAALTDQQVLDLYNAG